TFIRTGQFMTGRSPRSLQNYEPSIWEQIIGNRKVKRYFQKLVRRIRREADAGSSRALRHACFLLTGESRSGKTAAVKFLVRCIKCHRLDPVTLNPCDGTCANCRDRVGSEEQHGLFESVKTPDGQTEIHFHIIDCTKISTPAELIEKLRAIGHKVNTSGYVVVYLDEAHRLVARHMDEILLKEVEDHHYLWFFSTAKPEGLEDMFQNRLIKLATELPADDEMAPWLIDRCNEAGIDWEPEAILRVIDKSNRVVGIALQALTLAALDPDEGLTL